MATISEREALAISGAAMLSRRHSSASVLAAQAVQHDADFLFGRILPARRSANVLHDLLGGQFRVPDFWLISTP